jgi:hypothetical protein
MVHGEIQLNEHRPMLSFEYSVQQFNHRPCHEIHHAMLGKNNPEEEVRGGQRRMPA